ncbi:MAG TPA: YjjG family noncanonical pyrimidine nucleotidase [Draconibacterium sp.]|nr:YjjG family noncanonical pyrimidine nucleotidase [Draconibacterium sp.]
MKKVNRKYTSLFFDLDNTLWDFNTNSYHAMHVVFIKLGLSAFDVDFDHFFKVYSKYNYSLWNLYRNRGITKKELTKKRFQDTFDELGITGLDAEQMNNKYLNEMPNQEKLVDGAPEILNYLKKKNYQLFIITNGFKEVQYKKLQNAGIDTYFDKIFISEEVKSPKPSKEIFEYAITSSNASKAKSLMIGDDWETDILGALKFGIDSVYFLNSSKEEQKIHSGQKIYIITNLYDLMEIL